MLFFNFGPKRYNHLFNVVRKIKPKNIMEIGTYNAKHAIKLIKIAQKYNRNVSYYGFDLFEDMNPDINKKEYARGEGKQYQKIKNLLEKTGASITLFKGDTTKVLPKVVKKLPKMDFVFIDGGHSIETIASDWKYSQQVMQKGTIVIFDDYWNKIDAGCKTTVDKISRKKYNVQIIPIQDKFRKDWGVLTINLAQVWLK